MLIVHGQIFFQNNICFRRQASEMISPAERAPVNYHQLQPSDKIEKLLS